MADICPDPPADLADLKTADLRHGGADVPFYPRSVSAMIRQRICSVTSMFRTPDQLLTNKKQEAFLTLLYLNMLEEALFDEPCYVSALAFLCLKL